MKRIPGFCALCRSRCGCISVVEGDRLIAVEPDPTHPTGAALCAKGRAAPELVHHPERLLHPLKRTAPKGAADPGWQRITWDEALDETAARLTDLKARLGAEGVAFAITTGSGTSISDAFKWVERLMHAFGSPNNCYSSELCNWHKDSAHVFTFGCSVPTPDHAQAGTILLWGFNPSTSWLAHATRVAEAKARGARLVVIDPRRAGLAAKADLWLRVKPGTDAALALGAANLMIANRWYDEAFVKRWTSGPLLVRADTGRLVRAAELERGDNAPGYVAWDAARKAPARFDATTRTFSVDSASLALSGRYTIDLGGQAVECRPAFDLYAERCAGYDGARVAALTGVAADQLDAFARLLHERGPLAYYHWTGVGQHTNATQTDRAIALLAALTGSFDAPGGNVQMAAVATNDPSGRDLITESQRAKTLGLAARPLGPPADGWVTSDDLYRAVIEQRPYRVAGLVAFGTNLLLSHPDPVRGAEALKALEFYVHTDLFMNPSAAHADIVLPIASAFEREGLSAGFGLDQPANELVQLRPASVPPRGEARSDIWVVFELAKRLGLGGQFWNGDVDAAMRDFLAPSGVSLEQLRAEPRGIRVSLPTQHHKYREQGFATPTGLVEFYAERLLDAGQDPLPSYTPPRQSPEGSPALAARFPLRLTSAKSPLYCHSQQRGLPSLRKREADPTIDVHPATAKTRGLAEGDWARISTPQGSVNARIHLRRELDPEVVVGHHGWWQGCAALDAPAFAATGSGSANYNGLIGHTEMDPISGAPGMRSSLCQIEALR